MNLRRLTHEGTAQFASYVTNLKAEPTLSLPNHLLTEPSSSELAAEVQVEHIAFATRYEAAAYLDQLVRAAGIPNPERDAGLWAWLALFYFDQICPRDKGGGRKAGEHARYIPELEVARRYYRHMLLGPFVMYRAHVDDPARLLALLSNPMDVATSETYRLFIENPSLIACPAVVEVATWLYYDSRRGKIKRGAGSKDAGGCRRLIEYLQQIDCTFDLPVLTKGGLADMLPQEFRRFVPEQLEPVG